MKPKEFEDYLIERFQLKLPKEFQFARDRGSALRVYSISVNSFPHKIGSRGFVAYSKKTGISSDFIQIFGKFAKTNVVELKENEAKEFANGKTVRKKLKIKKGPIICTYKGHVLGIGTYESKVIYSKIKGKRRRNIINRI